MSKTSYDSPHGLGNALNYTTAEDQCKLIAVSMKIPEFRTVVGRKRFETPSGYCWWNSNPLLSTPGHNGGKTGWTPNADYCFADHYEKDGKRLAICVLASPTSDASWYWDLKYLVAWTKGENLND